MSITKQSVEIDELYVKTDLPKYLWHLAQEIERFAIGFHQINRFDG